MREILSKAKTVRELLKGVKYSIDYYQREYKWREKQIHELMNDLFGKFLEDFSPEHARSRVAEYPHYFLGPIIISKKDTTNFIVDGQQRLTSLTLLLIILRNLQKETVELVNVDELIVSEKYGEKSFNIYVDEREAVMESLFDNEPFDVNGSSESVVNIYQRYQDIYKAFPDELQGKALPYFIDWLLENVHLVEITAFSDEDAYTIFETMNDRGLSLSMTEMLKGYLLSNIEEGKKRNTANSRWRERIREFGEIGKEVESDFFKAWFRGQYAKKIRERKRGANPEEFDRIGTEFHRWLRDASVAIGLRSSDDFFEFIERDFSFFSRQFLRIVRAANKFTPGLEHIYYNAQHGFTLQYMLLLAPLSINDNDDAINKKLRLVGRFIDILVTWRIWNFRSISYSTMQYAMFLLMRDIRGMSPEALVKKLYDYLTKQTEKFDKKRFYVHQRNRYFLHRLLARLTDYIETQSGQTSRYLEYISEGKKRYEIEHIWANHPERHTDEFAHAAEFSEYRNRIGGLLLLPKSFNASYGDLDYKDKLPHYNSQNLLARSLHPQCYEHNPGFLRFVSDTGLPFKPYSAFNSQAIDERSILYQKIAELNWNPDDLLNEVNS